MLKECEVCNTQFKIKPYEVERRKTCSRKCMGIRQSGKIKTQCGHCKKEMETIQSKINKSKSGLVFCSNKCVGHYNAINRKQDLYNECLICNSKFKVIEATKDTHITCSRECQGKWQSKYRVGQNASNYRGGGSLKQCVECEKEYMTNNPYQTLHRKFCSKSCKQDYWVKHTLSSAEFYEARYSGITLYRETIGETMPEKIVKEALLSLGFTEKKDFYQEQGFFGKYYVDFFFPVGKIIIEVQGDFWHCNPNIYGYEDGKITPYPNQLERIEKDKVKKQEFIQRGFQYIELWESDIYEDIEKLLQQINLHFPSTTTRRTPKP